MNKRQEWEASIKGCLESQDLGLAPNEPRLGRLAEKILGVDLSCWNWYSPTHFQGYLLLSNFGVKIFWTTALIAWELREKWRGLTGIGFQMVRVYLCLIYADPGLKGKFMSPSVLNAKVTLVFLNLEVNRTWLLIWFAESSNRSKWKALIGYKW